MWTMRKKEEAKHFVFLKGSTELWKTNKSSLFLILNTSFSFCFKHLYSWKYKYFFQTLHKISFPDNLIKTFVLLSLISFVKCSVLGFILACEYKLSDFVFLLLVMCLEINAFLWVIKYVFPSDQYFIGLCSSKVLVILN